MSSFVGRSTLRVIAKLDKQRNDQADLTGFLSCAQFNDLRPVHFYIDTGCTFTTLLDIDIVKLGINMINLRQSQCQSITPVGPVDPLELPNVVIRLKDVEGPRQRLAPFILDFIHLLPSDDPTEIVPAQYEFGFSLLGMDILQKFRNWHFTDTELILES